MHGPVYRLDGLPLNVAATRVRDVLPGDLVGVTFAVIVGDKSTALFRTVADVGVPGVFARAGTAFGCHDA